MPRARLLLLLALLGAVAATIEIARLRSARARALFVGTFGALLREREHAAWSGASWLLAAYALSIVLFPRREAIAAMLAAGLGDAAAAVVGRSVATARATARARRGAPATVSRSKTLVGSVACALVTFVASLLVAALAPLAAAAAALAASVAERWDGPVASRIDDNVRVALAAGAAAWSVARLLGGGAP